MCSETSPETLSKDLGQKDLVKSVEYSSHDNSSTLQSTSEFEFIVGSSLEHESFSADELFYNGVIVPTQAREGLLSPQYVKRHHPKVSVASPPPPRPPILHPSPTEISEKVSNEGIVSSSNVEDKPKYNTSGWFSRSNSLKSDTKKSILCSLSLLPRSNSVGSVPNQKKAMSKQNSQRRSSLSLTKSFSFSSNHAASQKPPSKKNHVMKYGNGAQTSPSPVLNMPSSSIGIGASNLFGFSRLLPGKKDQKNCRSGSIT